MILDVTEAIQNYLETIYILSLKHDEVHAVDICNHLSYSRPTVSIVLRQMRESNLVQVDDFNHIHLTEEGMRIAQSLYERHNVISELFMSLGVSREVAVEDACKIEHDLSEETFVALKAHLQRVRQN